MEWREEDGLRWLEASLPGAAAAFSTRTGGTGTGDFESLNLGVLTEDDPEIVAENRHRLGAALGLRPERVVIGRQVHGAELAHHGGPQEPAPWARAGTIEPPRVDGHVLAPGADLAALVFVADCLPIALAGPEGIAILHGGWRGLAAGIIAAAVRATGATVAAIGPGIGRCCFEVGEEVLAAFAALGPVARGRMLDLPLVAEILLQRAGVEQVEHADLCTRCHPEDFFSHRGQGPRTGRQAGIVRGVS